METKKLAARGLQKALRKKASTRDALFLSRFFKTYDGGYAAGDKFLGIKVPVTREIAKPFRELPLSEIQKLLESPYHEERLAALVILVHQSKKGGEQTKKKLYDFYLANTKHINNWDLVDLSAKDVIGGYLFGKDTKVLTKLAKSKNLWERRIAVLATFYFIGKGEDTDALRIAELLVHDTHDLIHKAVGWMLREIGGRVSQKDEEAFLKKHAATMPRTMLRYAIEKFPESSKRHYMKLKNTQS